MLETMLDVDEVQDFSNSLELEANNIMVLTKSIAKRLSSIGNVEDASSSNDPRDASPENVSSAASSSTLPLKPQKDSSTRDSLIRLPEIPLPRFEGDLADWPLFRDRFKALVDNRSSITKIEKLYYMLNCLGADASEVVKGITVTNETYLIAWLALIERYDRPRRLASFILDKMLSATVLVKSLASLNKFLYNFDENIAVLESLQIPDLGDFLLFSVAFRTVPVSSRRLFEMNSTEDYP